MDGKNGLKFIQWLLLWFVCVEILCTSLSVHVMMYTCDINYYVYKSLWLPHHLPHHWLIWMRTIVLLKLWFCLFLHFDSGPDRIISNPRYTCRPWINNFHFFLFCYTTKNRAEELADEFMINYYISIHRKVSSLNMSLKK